MVVLRRVSATALTCQTQQSLLISGTEPEELVNEVGFAWRFMACSVMNNSICGIGCFYCTQNTSTSMYTHARTHTHTHDMNLSFTFKNRADDLRVLCIEPGEALQAATEVGDIPHTVPADFLQPESSVQHVTQLTDVCLHIMHVIHLLT